MKFLHKLIPDFLCDLDLRMQRDWPRLWSTRIHLHLWFLLLINLATALLAAVVNVSERKFPHPEELFIYMLVAVVVYLAFWVSRVVRFNVEKQFGKQKFFAPVGELLIHWASILLIISIPYTFSLVVAYRIASLTSDKDLVAEVDLLNQQAHWFYDDGDSHGGDGYDLEDGYYNDHYNTSIDHDLNTLKKAVANRESQGGNSHRFFRDIPEYKAWYSQKEEFEVRRAFEYHDHYLWIIRRANESSRASDTLNYDPDSAAYFHAIADSIELHSPLLYTEHGNYTPYHLVHYVQGPPYLKVDVLLHRYIEQVRNGSRPDPTEIERALKVGSKYSAFVRSLHPDTVIHQFDKRTLSTARLDVALPQLNSIVQAKALDYNFLMLKPLPFFLLLPSLLLALLVGAFKNSYWQPFLIAVITVAVAPIIIYILVIIVAQDVYPLDQGDMLAHAYWLISAFLILMLFFIYSLRTYRTPHAVMLILANTVLPFFAFFTIMMLHFQYDVFGEKALREFIYSRTLYHNMDLFSALFQIELEALSERINIYMMGTLWAGIILYTFLLHPMVRRLYMRLYALPERK